jgi:TusA-related sulfurtransferase
MTAEIELDMRGREPPEPLLEALDCIDEAKPADVIRLLTDREPLMLFPHLIRMNIPWTVESFGDPDWITRIGPVPAPGTLTML